MEMQIKPATRYHFTPIRIAIVKKTAYNNNLLMRIKRNWNPHTHLLLKKRYYYYIQKLKNNIRKDNSILIGFFLHVCIIPQNRIILL